MIEEEPSRLNREEDALDGTSERLLNAMDKLVPVIKLETMGVSLMRAMLGIMWTLGLFNLIVAIVLVGAAAGTAVPRFGDPQSLWDAVYTIEGVTRTIGASFLVLLLVAFPQRIIRHALGTRQKPLWTQLLLIVFTVLMAITPCYSLYDVVIYWGTIIHSRHEDFIIHDEVTTVDYSLGVISLLFPFSYGVLVYNTVTSMIVMAFMFIVFAGVYHNQYQSAQRTDLELHRETDRSKWDELYETRTAMSEYGADDEAEGEDHQASRAYQMELSLQAKAIFLDFFSTVKMACTKASDRYKDITGQMPFHFQFAATVYLILLIALPISLNFNPSVIPFISIITIGRMCTENVTYFLPFNASTLIDEDLDIGNVSLRNYTLTFAVESTAESDELGVCSPGQNNPVAFRRSIALTIFTVLELYLLISVYLISSKTRRFLETTSYAQTRREILGYYFFRHIALVCWTFMLVVGILITSVMPLEIYYEKSGKLTIDRGKKQVTLITVFDPLFQAGVGFGTLGFGAFFVMLIIWVILIAFAYLPADSDGIKGWFAGTPIKPGEENLTVALRKDDYLILIAKESEVQRLLALKRREDKLRNEQDFSGNARKLMRVTSTLDAVGRSIASDGSLLYLPPLVNQVHANLLVLETEILNFHFMHLSYVMAGNKFDLKLKGSVPLTTEDQQIMVEDTRFVLLEHIKDAATDTHVMVFSSADRIVVAFRGSVSRTNWQTDFDSSEVVCEYAANIEPELSDVPPGAVNYAKLVANRPPRVHGGFVKAYETVRKRLTEVCKREMTDLDTYKVLFVTGHSLGGGLAIISAVDLAVQLKLPPARIAVTTWGAPKVGTFSFMRRFNAVCPCARRFCMADDPITRLPPDTPMQYFGLSGWYHCGTEILMNDSGNMLIRPSPIERFMFRRNPVGSPQAHLRMTYATALMLWVIRSHPDYNPDWWISVVTLFYRNAGKRLKNVPSNIRDRLLDSLLKAGVTYQHNNKMVRDMMTDTAQPSVYFTQKSISSTDKRGEEPDLQPEAGELVTELLIALRLKDEGGFNSTLDTLLEMRKAKRLFLAKEIPAEDDENRLAGTKRKQVDIDTNGDDADMYDATDV